MLLIPTLTQDGDQSVINLAGILTVIRGPTVMILDGDPRAMITAGDQKGRVLIGPLLTQ